MCATLFQNKSIQMTCEMKTTEVSDREKNSPDDTPEANQPFKKNCTS
jgi:hypothetical protein